jgi:hypothetical protein
MQFSGKRHRPFGLEGSGLGLNLLYCAVRVMWVYTMYVHLGNHRQAC